MSHTVTFTGVHTLVLMNLLNIRIGGAPAWVVRGLESDATVDLECLDRLHTRLSTAFDTARDSDLDSAAVHVSVEPSEVRAMLNAVAPLLQEDRLQESECHALTGGHWSDAVDLIAWMTALSKQDDPAL